MKSEYKEISKQNPRDVMNGHQCCVSHKMHEMSSLASTFKVSCKHEVKVYECLMVEKVWRWHNGKKRVIWFTLRPRQAPCSKELCSFSYPKTNYEQSLNTLPILVWGLVWSITVQTQPPPLINICWGLNLDHTSPFFSPPLLPPNLPSFFSPSFLPSQQAGGTNTAEKNAVNPAPPSTTSTPALQSVLELPSEGKMADGRLLEKVCLAEGVDTTGGGQGWMGSGGEGRGVSGFSVHLT